MRFANTDWHLADQKNQIETWEKVGIAVLMDIREELRTLNRLLSCPNFTGIPATLRRISANTAKPKKKRKRIARTLVRTNKEVGK